MKCQVCFPLSPASTGAFGLAVLIITINILITRGDCAVSGTDKYSTSYFRVPCVDLEEWSASGVNEFHLFRASTCRNCSVDDVIRRQQDDENLYYAVYDDRFTPGRRMEASGYSYDWLIFLRSVRADGADESVDSCVRRTLAYCEVMTHCSKVCWSIWAEGHHKDRNDKVNDPTLVELGCACQEYLDRHDIFTRFRAEPIFPQIREMIEAGTRKAVDLFVKVVKKLLMNLFAVARKYGYPIASGLLVKMSLQEIKPKLLSRKIKELLGIGMDHGSTQLKNSRIGANGCYMRGKSAKSKGGTKSRGRKQRPH